jgi:hypothetical protein
MYLLGLAVQRRPLLLHLAVDLVGDLARLLQGLLRLVGDLRPSLLGLLLGLLDDGLGVAPGILDQLLGRAARLLEQGGGLPAELLQRRLTEPGDLALQLSPCLFGLGVAVDRLPQAGGEPGELALQLGPGLFGLGVAVDRLLQARDELWQEGVDLLAVIPAPHHPEGRGPVRIVLPRLRGWFVHAHGTSVGEGPEPVCWLTTVKGSRDRRPGGGGRGRGGRGRGGRPADGQRHGVWGGVERVGAVVDSRGPVVGSTRTSLPARLGRPAVRGWVPGAAVTVGATAG